MSDTHGAIWDLNADHSLAHGARRYRCRCTLEVDVEVDWDKIEEFNELKTNLEFMGIKINLGKEIFKLSSMISEARQQMGGFLGDMTQLKNATQETNQALTLYLALGRRIGSEDLTQLISLFQRGRLTAEMFTRALITLTAASGPWGWLLGAGQLVLSGLMLSDMMTARRPRY